jgi:dipeptidyl aminopeptidase/acylaminoacyl peptidase
MTTFERFERDIPELMTELAPTRVPDYFDDMLRQTASHRQRPAWSYPERWLPMGVIARTVPMRRPVPWRPLLLVALLALLVAAGLVAYIGAPPRLPPPFGPARAGPILMSTADGDLVSLDPVTGKTTSLVTSPETEDGATFSPDGRSMFFARVSPDQGLFVANADGSNVHNVLGPADRLTWIDWSPDSDRIVATGQDASGVPEILLIDPRGGPATTLRLGRTFRIVQGRYGSDELILTEDVNNRVQFWVANASGSELRQIPASTDAINEGAISPDGNRLAYATWGAGDGRGERLRVVDIDSGDDRLITTHLDDQVVWQGAQFSPDGRKILTQRFIPGTYTYRLVIIPVAGDGPDVPLGVDHTSSGGLEDGSPDVLFAPDGTKVYVRYHDDATTWLFDAATGSGTQVSWPSSTYVSWQRLAP